MAAPLPPAAPVPAPPAPVPTVRNVALVTTIRNFSLADANVAALVVEAVAILNDAILEFNLAPNEYADVERLPLGVRSLTELIEYLRTIKTKLAARDPKQKTEDWAVARSGELRLYKTFVCCLNALYRYHSLGVPANWGIQLNLFVRALTRWASVNPPVGLSKSGTKLWNSVFEQDNSRSIIAIKTVLHFCLTPVVVPIPPPPPAAPGALGGDAGV